MQGIFKSAQEGLKSLWTTRGTAPPLFQCTTTLARFSLSLVYLHFEYGTIRREMTEENKLVAISNLCEQFVNDSKENYLPGCNVIIDEMLDFTHCK